MYKIVIELSNRKTYENEYSYLEDELSDKLGTRVKIKKNRVEITFTNNNDLNSLYFEIDKVIKNIMEE